VSPDDALRFVDERRIEPLVLRLPADDVFKTTPLFAHLRLAPHELRQLGYLFRLNSSRTTPSRVDATLTDALVARSTYRFFEERGDDLIRDVLLSVPIEWWNVIDPRGEVRYQVWIYAAMDGGFVFPAGTAGPVGSFGQGTWFTAFDAPLDGIPGSRAAPSGLARQLASALAIHGDRDAIDRWLGSQLAHAHFA
jgi:hypothetical protein